MGAAASADVYPSVASSALLLCRGITRDLRRGPKQRVHSPDRGAGKSAVGPPPPGTQDAANGSELHQRRVGSAPYGSDAPGSSAFKRHLGNALTNEISNSAGLDVPRRLDQPILAGPFRNSLLEPLQINPRPETGKTAAAGAPLRALCD